jgi:hypothetical protein
MTKSRHVNMPKGLSLAEKIEYHSIPEPNSGCLLWMGRLGGSRPYAVILHDGKHLKVTRVVMATPPHLEAMHRCDNTYCIERTHLFNGTHSDNMQDAASKNRFGKLTREQRLAIRQDRRAGIVIAAEYGIHPTTVSGIRGRTRGVRNGFA